MPARIARQPIHAFMAELMPQHLVTRLVAALQHVNQIAARALDPQTTPGARMGSDREVLHLDYRHSVVAPVIAPRRVVVSPRIAVRKSN